MDTEVLKKLQTPLKEKYREKPNAAWVTLQAEGKVGAGVTCTIDNGRMLVEAGLHPATGGSGLLACSGNMLLEALIACAGVTLRAVSTAIGVELRSATIHAEGDLDFRGTLGVAKDVPVGFKAIRLHFELDTDASAEQITTLLQMTERFCVIYQTLDKGVSVNTKMKKVE
jgi:uncharacterized OsmC-like protein